MVVRAPGVEYPMIWESTPLKFIEDVIMHKMKSGARLVSLNERLAIAARKKFYGRIAIGRLEVEKTPELMEALKNFMAGEVHYLPFPSRRKFLVEFIRRSNLKGKKDKSVNVYCAELVAETYKQMGLLPPDEPSNHFAPKDFSSKEQLPLLKGLSSKRNFFRVDTEFLSRIQDSE